MISDFAWVLFPVQVIFLANAGGHLIYAMKLNQKHNKEHNIGNSVITVILWFIAGGLYPLYFRFPSPQGNFFKFLSMFFISIFTPFIVFLILAYQYIVVVKNEPEIKQKRNIDRFLDEFESHNSHNTDSNSHSLKNDIYRKALHIFPAAVILLLWVFAVYIWDGMWHADVIWGITGEQFGTFLIITAGYSGILVFAALDYVRLSYVFQQRKLFHLLPDNVSDLLSKSMKYNEIFEFTKSAAMVLAFTPIFFLPFGIFIAAALITTLGDAAASVIGIRYGTLHFPEHSPKTIRGFISGTIASFLIALCSFIIFLPSLSPLKIVLISTAGALTFLVTDIANLNIDDNMLNPLLCGAVMGIVYFIL